MQYVGSPLANQQLFSWSDPHLVSGDGKRAETSVVFSGVEVFYQGRQAIEEWLKRTYPKASIAGVETEILNHRVLRVITLKDSDGQETKAYIDMTSFVCKPNLGQWFLLAENGDSWGGELTEEYLQGHKGSRPWEDVIAANDAVLVFQVDDEKGNGLLGWGKFRNGMKNGTWTFSRQKDGLVREGYDMGVKVKEDLSMFHPH